MNIPFNYFAFAVALFQCAFQATAENLDPVSNYTIAAVSESNAINITWATPTETNSDYFIIQRSRDGILFDDIMQEMAAGNSSEVSSYSITDYKPYSETSFYRVVEVDMNGRITHKVLTVANLKAELSTSVYPGLSGNTFNISTSSKKEKQVLLVLKDMEGNEYYSKFILIRSVDEIVAVEPEGKLPPGLYTITASSNNAIFSKKVIITR